MQQGQGLLISSAQLTYNVTLANMLLLGVLRELKILLKLKYNLLVLFDIVQETLFKKIIVHIQENNLLFV